MNKKPNEKLVKASVIVIIFSIFILIFVSSLGDTQTENKNISEQKVQEKADPLDIRVTSQIVKKVDKKYRYFFDIRNHDLVPFSGSVKIELYNEQGKMIMNDTFTTNQPIDPNLGTSVYIDTRTGTPNIHGEFGISTFKFEVTKNNQIIASGSGEIQ